MEEKKTLKALQSYLCVYNQHRRHQIKQSIERPHGKESSKEPCTFFERSSITAGHKGCRNFIFVNWKLSTFWLLKKRGNIALFFIHPLPICPRCIMDCYDLMPRKAILGMTEDELWTKLGVTSTMEVPEISVWSSRHLELAKTISVGLVMRNILELGSCIIQPPTSRPMRRRLLEVVSEQQYHGRHHDIFEDAVRLFDA